MENENKDIELEEQNTAASEHDEVNMPEEPESGDMDFDPTLSEEFYNNLEEAIKEEPVLEGEAELPELSFPENTFSFAEEEKASPEEEELFAGVDAALSAQIAREFGKEEAVSEEEENEEKPTNKVVAFFKKVPTWTKVLATVIFLVLLSVGLLFGTKGGKRILINIAMEWAFGKINEGEELTTPSPLPSPTETPTPTLEATPEPTGGADTTPAPSPTEEPALTPEPTPTPTPSIVIMDDPDIINVLLIGVENMKGAKYGRSDAMILVSIDLNGGPLKMISFQRDLFVAIPRNGNDRLNAAYAFGGASLLVETMEQNFGVDIDSYIKVEFDGFENIIDQLGGLKISLTARESDYLNTTKYISDPSQRNTVAGEQRMTGAQVLGFCRVRKVPTANGLTDDRGRNYRQRMVLQALFNQFKSKNITELSQIMNQCFEYVTAPTSLKSLATDALGAVFEHQMYEIETMQVPQSGLYTNAIIEEKDVCAYDPACVDKLQEFIYGE